MRFASAIHTVPEPCQIAGTVLRPFCLGHHLLFKKLELPFAGSALAGCEPEQMIIGIIICAASYEQTLEWLHTGEWTNICERWRKAARKNRKLDWDETMLLFRAYLQDGYQKPPTHHRPGQEVALTSPWEQLLKCRLVQNGFSETEVLNGYLPARWYDYFTLSELNNVKNCKEAKDLKPVFATQEYAEGYERS